MIFSLFFLLIWIAKRFTEKRYTVSFFVSFIFCYYGFVLNPFENGLMKKVASIYFMDSFWLNCLYNEISFEFNTLLLIRMLIMTLIVLLIYISWGFSPVLSVKLGWQNSEMSEIWKKMWSIRRTDLAKLLFKRKIIFTA